jgi:hypothetical protein
MNKNEKASASEPSNLNSQSVKKTEDADFRKEMKMLLYYENERCYALCINKASGKSFQC